MLFNNSGAFGIRPYALLLKMNNALISISVLPAASRPITYNIQKLFRISVLITGLFLLTSNFTQAQNAIVTENALPGNPYTDWGVNSGDDFRNPNINGFATDISVNKGSTVHFKVDGQNGVDFFIQIYRLGYYGGDGARFIADLGNFTGIKQPAGIADPVTGLLDCSNWTETTSWTVPANAVSGIYIAKIESAAGRNHIVFIVRNDGSNSKILFQANDASWQAYNGYGGNNVYNGTTSFPQGHAVKVSYNRPFFIYNAFFATDGRGSDWYMNDTYPMLRWLERNGYDVTYTTNTDIARSGAELLTHKIFVTAGHDEYWSKEQRDNVEAARAAGVNMAFFTGNETYWKTRWENDVNGNPNRVLVCYKEGTLADGTTGEATCGSKCDVSSPIWTGLWRMGAAYDAGLPENALSGEISWDQPPAPSYGVPILVPDTYKNLRFWRNTSVATLGVGATATMAPNSLGYEFDYEQFPQTYPHGRILLSSTSLNGHTHKLSLYRNGGTGGPLIFGAGTIQWVWGLDDQHFGGTGNAVSPDMQQATVNLFADMGVQPETLQTDLVAATESTDFTAPVSTIVSPVNGSTQTISSLITISGTASDADGAVGGVEVSVDGGVTWQVATGTNNWTFSWNPPAIGTYTIKSRAFDDSGNMQDGTVSTGPNVITVTLTNAPCPCNIFTTQTPANGTVNDGSPIELGVKFQSSDDGFITGIRFYKTAGNNGTHIGELYSISGTRLASATFSGETGTGWQVVTFSSPVAITANTTYVAAYFSPDGTYTGTHNYFTDPVINSPLTGLADGTAGPNGVYKYNATAIFPDQTYLKSNYWVDVVFNQNNTPLPVKYLNFIATRQGNNVILQWMTSEEANNKGFEIQRSVDGANWNVIGFVAGAGNSEVALNYQYTDKDLSPARYYYRLRQIDLDGKSDLSKVVSVTISGMLTMELLQNRPNPFDNSTTIVIIIPQTGRISLTLYDQMGRPVRQLLDAMKQPGTYSIEMSRNGLSSGMYYYKLDGLGQSQVRKMTIY